MKPNYDVKDFKITYFNGDKTRIRSIGYLKDDIKYNVNLESNVFERLSRVFKLVRERQLYNINIGVVNNGKQDVLRLHFNKEMISKDDHIMLFNMLRRIKSLGVGSTLRYISHPVLVMRNGKKFPCQYLLV